MRELCGGCMRVPNMATTTTSTTTTTAAAAAAPGGDDTARRADTNRGGPSIDLTVEFSYVDPYPPPPNPNPLFLLRHLALRSAKPPLLFAQLPFLPGFLPVSVLICRDAGRRAKTKRFPS
jgi:hypothetical protein